MMQQPAPEKQINDAQTQNTLKQELRDLNKNLKALSDTNRKRNVILRGLINGVFTAIGATLGFALFLSIFSGALKQAESVPFLDRLIKSSKIEPIVEQYLEELNKPTPKPTNTPVPTSTPSPTPTLEPTVTPTVEPTTDSSITL